MSAGVQSIRRKLSGIVMLTSTMAVLVVCAAAGVKDFFDERNDLDRDLSALSEMISTNSPASLTFGDAKGAGEVLTLLRTRESIIGGCIYTAAGLQFATFRKNGAVIPAHAPLRDGVFRHDGLAESIHGINVDGVRIGTIYIASDLRELHARMQEDAVFGTLVILISLMAAFLLSGRLQRVISEPIVELAKVAKRVSTESDYGVRASSRTAELTHEIGELVAGFNGMLAEIEKRDARLMFIGSELESLVGVRTAELRRANDELISARDAAERIAEINGRLSRSNQLILDAAADGIMGFDSCGLVTFMNPAAERALGWSFPEVLGRRLHDLAHSDAAGNPCDIEDCVPSRLRQSGNVILGSDTLRRKDGTTFPAEYSSMPISDGAGGHQGFVVTFRDTTERRAVERLKDEFVSTVSHELRTPLTSIRGALGLLSSGMLGPVPEKGQRMLQIAVTNTDRLVRLINDILDLERIESGRIELVRSAVNASDLITESVDGVLAMAGAADVEIRIDRHIAGVSLWVDRDRIVQTLTNLLSNAIKFSPRGTRIEIGGSATDNTFTFRVSDQGRGVPAEKHEVIFERFQQVDASDSRAKGGSGLGLAICRSIVNAHGGRIWVESEEGVGSAFRFTVPLQVAIASDDRAALRSLLVYSDTEGAAIGLVRMLEVRGDVAYVAMNPEAVCVRAAETAPSAIVLDLGSETANGQLIVETLRASAITQTIPIVVITASKAACHRFGGNVAEWVQKPFTGSVLTDAVAAACATGIRTVLIVEDDPDLARVMTATLESHGLRVFHAATGGEAVETARECEPDLIVLDVVLPDTDGFAVVELLRASATLRELPLVVYSALEVCAADQPRLKLGQTEFLTKSRGTLPDLEMQVMRLLDSLASKQLEDVDAA